MIVTFVSTYLNHHQLSLCEELRKRCDEFYYIATGSMPSERGKFGYEDVNTKYDFVVRAFDSSTKVERIKELLSVSDVVIFGSCPNKYIEYRMRQNKLSFLYSERFFKKGVWRRFIPRTRKNVTDRVVRFKDKELYALCASAFLPWDLKLLGFSPDKCFCWGYFPQVNEYDICPKRNNSTVKILWAGRMLDWKRTKDAIKVAAKLRNQGLDFTFDIIGCGDMDSSLQAMVKKYKLSDRVTFLGSMAPQQVAEKMEQSDIFLMTSNFREGWGAVVNEAMSTGCAVLASSAVGSVPYLINDGKNGLIYKYGDNGDFAKKLRVLIENKPLRESLGVAAYKTIKHDYCAKVAAERLIEFAKSKSKSEFHYETGPMSKAPVIKNNWYKK